MGSKHIKAIAIRGSHPITVADPQGLMAETLKLIQTSQGPGTQKYRVLGTPTNVLNMNKMGVLPTRNFSETVFEHAEEVSGEYMHDHFTAKAVGCSGCSIACEQWAEVKEGKYKGAIIGPGLRVALCAGPQLRHRQPAADHPARRQMCDELGIDTMSTGVVGELGHGVLRARHPQQRRVRRPGAQLWQRRRRHRAAGQDRQPRGHRRPAGRGRQARLGPRWARAASTLPCTSRAWRCPATTCAACRPLPWAWPWARAAPATTARWPTKLDIKGTVNRFTAEPGRGKHGQGKRRPRRGA